MYAYQLSGGTDLSAIDGFGDNTILTLLAETGLDLGAQFPSAKHFVSWLGLCPNNKVTGGKVFSRRTQQNKGRLAQAFRNAANAVGNQKDTALSDAFRKLASRKGRKLAITAIARKLALTAYNILVLKQAYKPDSVEDYREKVRTLKIKSIQRTMRHFSISNQELLAAA